MVVIDEADRMLTSGPFKELQGALFGNCTSVCICLLLFCLPPLQSS
jgi:hypothetical protein